MKFATLAFMFTAAQINFEQRLLEFIGEYDRIGFDEYDGSLEIYEVGNEVRLSAEAQAFLNDAGFAITYVNHCDGWTTFYYANKITDKPWRRKDKTGCGFLINYLPESWIAQGATESSGNWTVVSD